MILDPPPKRKPGDLLFRQSIATFERGFGPDTFFFPLSYTMKNYLPQKQTLYRWAFLSCLLFVSTACGPTRTDQPEPLPPQCSVTEAQNLTQLSENFLHPGTENQAWVYWFVMDGNLTREGIKADLEAMKRAGIGGVIFLEVNVGIPRGPVDFMSPEWIELFKYACEESERLGLSLSLITGPGWTGSGGPWVKPEDAMHFIVADTLTVHGGQTIRVQLPRPQPRTPYFGMNNLTDSMKQQRAAYYQDLFVLAYPKNKPGTPIEDIDRKAFYVRHPYSSSPLAKPYLPVRATYPALPEGVALQTDRCIDLSKHVSADGLLEWEAPAGEWIVYRFGQTLTGANTRPSPHAGVGFECSKMDTTALNHHLDAYIGALMKAVGKQPGYQTSGWNMLHIDSWEMGPENWSDDFYDEFQKRRGYDPRPYLPALTGQAVDNTEISERFLWDLRQTVQELMLENHAEHLRRYAHQYGFGLSIEPYDMSPNNDIALGSIADVPMCETWEKDDLFNTAFSCIEAVSAANLYGRPIVGAEAFTSHNKKFWRVHPGNMKDQADWAFCIGINRLVFHRYAHQPWTDRYPGMTMGPYGMNYERTQTWWELSQSWHTYLARCQYLLRQGRGVADILFLTPEGAPMAFMPPESALSGSKRLPFKKGYNFDGCDPKTLLSAQVRDGKIIFPSGMEYRILVLPTEETMTPTLLTKIESLVRDGATVMGFAPQKSPSLQNYPQADQEIEQLTARLWGDSQPGTIRSIGKGRLIHSAASDTTGNEPSVRGYLPPYVRYEVIAEALRAQGIQPDFEADAPLRYIHRTLPAMDIYMVSNPDTTFRFEGSATFRIQGKKASLWDASTGQIAPISVEATPDGRSRIALSMDPSGSLFVIFSDEDPADRCNTQTLWATWQPVKTLTGPWNVQFQAGRKAPEQATFDTLIDWSQHADPGIRYFSGIANYTHTFTLTDQERAAYPNWSLDLGKVAVIARVELNGHSITELWKAPYRCDITPYLQAGENSLRISVANEWPNRLAGDQRLPESERVTFATYSPITRDFTLLPSGLLGPVVLCGAK